MHFIALRTQTQPQTQTCKAQHRQTLVLDLVKSVSHCETLTWSERSPVERRYVDNEEGCIPVQYCDFVCEL